MVRTNTDRVLYSLIGSLFVASICSGADKIKRIDVLNFECSGEVESSTYVGSTQTCSASDYQLTSYGQNHNDSSEIDIYLTKLCDYADLPHGDAIAVSVLDNNSMTLPYLNQESTSVTIQSDLVLTLDLYANSGTATNNPVFDAVGLSKGDSDNSSQYKSMATQDRNLQSSFLLTSDLVSGQYDLEQGSFIQMEVKDSVLTAVYMGGYWVVFGDLEDATTSNPNQPARSIFHVTTDEELNFPEIASEVVAGQGEFASTVEMSGFELNGSAVDAGGSDITEWEVSGAATFGVYP